MVDEQTLQKVASLARLELSDTEKSLYAKDMQDVLEQFETLAQAPVEEQEILITPTKEETPMRKDKAVESTLAKEARKLAKHKKEEYYKGPQAI